MSLPIQPLNDTFAVAPQLQAEDMKDVAAAGFRSVIINRPDGEGGEEQPLSADVMAAAQEAGLAVAYLPVVSGAMTQQNVDDFKTLLSEMPGPILAYCRSGTRCTFLYRAATEA